MKKLILVIIALVGIAVTAGFGFFFFNLSQADIVIEDLTKTVLSSAERSDKMYAIQKAVSQNNLGEFSEIILTNLKSDYSDGEKITFDLTLFGYYDWCLFPNLSVYYEKYNKPIWESSITHHCPHPSGIPHPVISYWKSNDFNQFPACRYDGIHAIYGESYKFGPKVLGQYYCHGKKEFHPPNTFQIVISDGASNPDLKINFEPSEINARWGDYINFINNDNTTHVIIGESERTKHTDSVEYGTTLEPSKSFQMKLLSNGTIWIYSQTEENKRFDWMRGIIHVD